MKKQQMKLAAKAGFAEQNKNTVIVTADKDWLIGIWLLCTCLRGHRQGILEARRNCRLKLTKDGFEQEDVPTLIKAGKTIA
jgi:hypothetical protein